MMNSLRSDSTENKVSFLLLLLFALALPFDRFYSELLLLALLAHTALSLRMQRWRGVPVPQLLAQGSIWLLTLVGTAYGSFQQDAFPFWERQCALLLLPLCIYLLDIDLQRYRHLLLYAFAAVVSLVTAYLFIDALRTMLYYRQPIGALWSPAYLSHNFAAPLDLHATYLSLYLAIAFTLLTQQLLARKHSGLNRSLLLFAILLLGAGLVQLASRAVLTGQLLVCLAILPFALRQKKERAYYLATILVLCVAASLLLHRFPHLYQRLVTDLGADLDSTRGNGLIADPRAARWRLCLGLIGEAPLFGHGSGSEVVLLRAAYFRNGLYDSYLHSLNAHNQYLSLLIRHGTAGLLCWLASLWVFARLAWRSRDSVLAAFLLLFACTGASENLLDVNKGVFFYAFFLSLLSAAAKNTAPAPPQSNPTGTGHVRIKQASKPART